MKKQVLNKTIIKRLKKCKFKDELFFTSGLTLLGRRIYNCMLIFESYKGTLLPTGLVENKNNPNIKTIWFNNKYIHYNIKNATKLVDNYIFEIK